MECLAAARESIRSISVADLEVAHKRFGELSAILRRLDEVSSILSMALDWKAEGRLDDLHRTLISYISPGVSYRVALAKSRAKEIIGILDGSGFFGRLESCPQRIEVWHVLKHPKMAGLDVVERAKEEVRKLGDITRPARGWRYSVTAAQQRIPSMLRELEAALAWEGLVTTKVPWKPSGSSKHVLQDIIFVIVGAATMAYGVASTAAEVVLAGLWLLVKKSERYTAARRERAAVTLDEFMGL